MVTGSVLIIFFIVAHDIHNLFDRSSGETESVRLCRRKAMECQRTAMITTNPVIRIRFFHLAKLWREMADEAARTNVSSNSKEPGVVLFLNQFQKAK